MIGDAPERVWLASIDLSGDWRDWKATERVEALRPEPPWEGADLPVEPSLGGAINVPVNQLRDPAIFEEDGRIYFLYAVAGEQGVARSPRYTWIRSPVHARFLLTGYDNTHTAAISFRNGWRSSPSPVVPTPWPGERRPAYGKRTSPACCSRSAPPSRARRSAAGCRRRSGLLVARPGRCPVSRRACHTYVRSASYVGTWLH